MERECLFPSGNKCDIGSWRLHCSLTNDWCKRLVIIGVNDATVLYFQTMNPLALSSLAIQYFPSLRTKRSVNDNFFAWVPGSR